MRKKHIPKYLILDDGVITDGTMIYDLVKEKDLKSLV